MPIVSVPPSPRLVVMLYILVVVEEQALRALLNPPPPPLSLCAVHSRLRAGVPGVSLPPFSLRYTSYRI